MELILANNNTMVALNGMQVKRTQKIAERTGDIAMGLVKAQMIELLKNKMANGVAHFIFKKKDGSIREAWGTIQSNIAAAKTNGRGENRENYYTTAFFDVEKGEWRSLRWESLIKVF